METGKNWTLWEQTEGRLSQEGRLSHREAQGGCRQEVPSKVKSEKGTRADAQACQRDAVPLSSPITPMQWKLHKTLRDEELPDG